MWLLMINIQLLLFMACATGKAFAAPPPPSKSEAVGFFSALKEQNTVRLQETDKTIVKKLDDTKDTRTLSTLHAEIEKLRTDKRELLLRQEFLDRMILQFDSKYEGQHPREFLENVLKSMAEVEISSDRPVTIWPFLDNLRRLIARVPDTQDRVLNLVEGYMKQTSIAHPMMPDDFLANVAYSNGSQSESAKPMPRTEVGAFADKQLKQIASAPVGQSSLPSKLVVPAPPEAPAEVLPKGSSQPTDEGYKDPQPPKKTLAN